MNVEKKANMKFPRAGHSVCAIGTRFIFVSGSRSKHTEASKRCEMFNINMDAWWKVGDLNVPRHYHSSCSIGDDFVYVFCGIDSLTEKYIDSIEKFDNNKPDSWILIQPSMRLPVRQGCGVAVINQNEIIIFGGYSARYLKDAYVFDCEKAEVAPLSYQPVQEIFCYQMPTLYDARSE